MSTAMDEGLWVSTFHGVPFQAWSPTLPQDDHALPGISQVFNYNYISNGDCHNHYTDWAANVKDE